MSARTGTANDLMANISVGCNTPFATYLKS
jgi:hypothetical protein